MSPRYIRRELETTDRVGAALVAVALAVGVGVVAYYAMRLVLSREPLGVSPQGAGGPEETPRLPGRGV